MTRRPLHLRFALALAFVTLAVPAVAQTAAPGPEPLAPLPATATPTAPTPAPAPAVSPERAVAPPPPPPLTATEDSEIGTLGGFELGLRTGIALPNGSIAGATPLSDVVSNHIPLWLDLGYRVSDRISVGMYGQYGVLSVKCNPGFNCSGFDARFGAELIVHLMPRGETDPWLGAGVGYEIMQLSASGASSQDITVSGFEPLNLQAGLDWRATPAFAVGPFASFTLSQFTDASNGQTSVSIPNTAMHEWLTLGLRGVFM